MNKYGYLAVAMIFLLFLQELIVRFWAIKAELYSSEHPGLVNT